MFCHLLKPLAFQVKNGARNFSSTSKMNFKVAIAGSSGGIGQSLALLMTLNPKVSAVSCHDISPVTPGVAVDLSHIDTPVTVTAHTGVDKLAEAIKDADLIMCPAGMPRKIHQTRDDLFGANATVIRQLATAMINTCSTAMCCIITNPVNSTLPLLSELLKKSDAYDPRRIFGVTTLDLVRSSRFVADINGDDPRSVWVPVICGHSLYTIVPVLSQSKPPLKLTDQAEIKALFTRIQAAGHEVAEGKANFGTATLSMAFSAARFGNSLIRGLSGEPNVVECAYVKSEDTEAAYFATPLLLGKCGIEKNLGIPPLNDFEKEQLKEAMPHLLKNIKKGVDFANEEIPSC